MTREDDLQALDKIFEELFGIPELSSARRFNPDLADLFEWATPAQRRKLGRLIVEIIANRDKRRD